MVHITSANQFREIIETGQISIIQKRQKVSGYNYFLSPNIGFQLYGAKVLSSDPNYLVLGFDIAGHASLFSLLKYVDDKIKDYLKTSYIIESTVFHNLYKHLDTERTFSIRCYLPHLGNRYFTECTSDGKRVGFNIPRKFATIDSAYVEIRNVWESNNRLGYNIELKSVII